ncbi:zinc ribbon domain-containing protein [Paenibacillus odorifer]|uniref:zinc ribbon domain-containing protein n=1 Tax=Paenibacillus odorifer TaxID=189426 RepID=UPI0009D69D8E|nr:zinc ribbon domain-containing protein [Paenibacillus odorifer]
MKLYLFTKKIKCVNCGGNYKGMRERDKEKYVCSSYSNYRTCVRHVVEQRKLVYLVANHIEIEQVKSGAVSSVPKTRGRPKKTNDQTQQITSKEISEAVNQINVDPVNKTIEILYNDNTRTFVSDDGIYY